MGEKIPHPAKTTWSPFGARATAYTLQLVHLYSEQSTCTRDGKLLAWDLAAKFMTVSIRGYTWEKRQNIELILKVSLDPNIPRKSNADLIFLSKFVEGRGEQHRKIEDVMTELFSVYKRLYGSPK
jgi:hypothetical protein